MTILAQGLIKHKQQPQRKLTARSFWIHLLIIVLAAAALRAALAVPALKDVQSLMRPDSMGYWNPALALAQGEGFVSFPGSMTPEAVRTIGYPAMLAAIIVLAGKTLLGAAIAGIILSALSVLPLALAVRKVSGVRPALLAGWLWAFNLTSVAAAPLILADTLLAFFCAWQFCMCVYFMLEKKLRYLAVLSVLAALGAVIKPVNLPVLIIGLPILLIAGADSGKKFLQGLLLSVVLAGAILIPYWVRNYRLCGDFEGNSANIYFHNGSAIMAHATGESSELWRQRLLDKAAAEFAANPEKYASLQAQNEWKKQQLLQMIQDHPTSAIITHLPNIFNLMPDVPTLLENNHITTTGRGTMAVLRQQGFVSAVQHYLGGRWYILAGLLPLLAVYALTLLLALWRLLYYIITWQWRWLLVFGVLVFYYIWAPGPVISARYLLPALPMIIFMAAGWKNSIKTSNSDQ